MPIIETTKKIHFLPYYHKRGRQKNTTDAPKVNVFVKTGKIQFGRSATDQMLMTNRFVRFYFDPMRKIIGWKVTDHVDQKELKSWKLCKPHANGVWSVSIVRMLSEFQGRNSLEDAYKGLTVQKYRNLDIMAEPNDTYFFVQLKKEGV